MAGQDFEGQGADEDPSRATSPTSMCDDEKELASNSRRRQLLVAAIVSLVLAAVLLSVAFGAASSIFVGNDTSSNSSTKSKEVEAITTPNEEVVLPSDPPVIIAAPPPPRGGDDANTLATERIQRWVRVDYDTNTTTSPYQPLLWSTEDAPNFEFRDVMAVETSTDNFSDDNGQGFHDFLDLETRQGGQLQPPTATSTTTITTRSAAQDAQPTPVSMAAFVGYGNASARTTTPSHLQTSPGEYLVLEQEIRISSEFNWMLSFVAMPLVVTSNGTTAPSSQRNPKDAIVFGSHARYNSDSNGSESGSGSSTIRFEPGNTLGVYTYANDAGDNEDSRVGLNLSSIPLPFSVVFEPHTITLVFYNQTLTIYQDAQQVYTSSMDDQALPSSFGASFSSIGGGGDDRRGLQRAEGGLHQQSLAMSRFAFASGFTSLEGDETNYCSVEGVNCNFTFGLIDPVMPSSTRPFLAIPGTCQNTALEWLRTDDTEDIKQMSVERIRQRFALAVFYCELNGDNWRRKVLWFSALHECDWQGQGRGDPCSPSRQIQTIHLNDNNMEGTLPPELAMIPTLLKVNLRYNLISGSIPTELSKLSELKALDLSNNALQGPIPDIIWKYKQMMFLSLASNNGLSGTIPDSLNFYQPRLRVLDLGGNAITGTIPIAFAFFEMTALMLHDNLLTGSIPKEINMASMEALSLHNNRLRGTIPGSFSNGGAPLLRALTLDQNDDLSGDLSGLCQLLDNVRFFKGQVNETNVICECCNPSPYGNFAGSLFEDKDPWQGLKPGDVVRWNSSGGLEMEVVNAMESQWGNIFDAVVEDWDNGTPKVLNLTTQKQSPDPECTPIDNKSKVCNSNYGNTKWRGINQVLIQNGYIISTTSKMNEYYLEKSSEALKRYTMCHEIGHSFGLPHSDEDFFNANLGNCMDYTSNPAANISPDASNFLFLQDLYGTIPTGLQGKADSQDGSGGRGGIPDTIRSRLREIVPQLENRVDGNSHEDGWKLLHQSRHEKVHTMTLGGGWSVQMRKLLAAPTND